MAYDFMNVSQDTVQRIVDLAGHIEDTTAGCEEIRFGTLWVNCLGIVMRISWLWELPKKYVDE